MPRIIHIFSQWHRTRLGDQRRHADAVASWSRAFAGVDHLCIPIHETSLKRNAKTVLGDQRTLPFWKDIIDAGIEQAHAAPDDIIAWTNDDVAIAEGAGLEIAEMKCGYGSRRDFMALPRRVTKESVAKGASHMGADLLFFPAEQWPMLRTQFPDFVLGREAFDIVYRNIIVGVAHGGRLENVLAHAIHEQHWQKYWDHPSSKHNNKLGAEYAEKMGTELKFL
jgi:hypothetical protein